MNIPILPAPGVGGLVPRLSIDYGGGRERQRLAERQPGDLLGYGWRIGGLSAIQRCTKGKDTGADIGYAATDNLCLDGEPLVLVQGTKWAAAQYNMGLMHVKGEGVPKDESEAALSFRKAADQGHAEAQHNLGIMLANGTGVPKDQFEAVEWYRRAADQGLAAAQFQLGVHLLGGAGVPKDAREAAEWYRGAAVQGTRRHSSTWRSCTTRERASPRTWGKPTAGIGGPPSRLWPRPSS